MSKRYLVIFAFLLSNSCSDDPVTPAPVVESDAQGDVIRDRRDLGTDDEDVENPEDSQDDSATDSTGDVGDDPQIDGVGDPDPTDGGSDPPLDDAQDVDEADETAADGHSDPSDDGSSPDTIADILGDVGCMDPRCADGPGVHCEGETRVQCNVDEDECLSAVTTDCTAQGGTCELSETFGALCDYPIPPGTGCELPVMITEGHYELDSTEFPSTYTDYEAECDGFGYGSDVTLQVTVPAGETLIVTATPTDWDLSIAISTECPDIGTTCVAFLDDYGESHAESASYENSGSEAVWYVVIDGWGVPQYGAFSLDVSLE